jgi:CheY-like chemotaxis protein
MARIVCFTDSPILRQQVQQSFEGSDHRLQVHTASQLTRDLRVSVQQFAPDLILIELSRSVDNPHLFFFLRSDKTTRNIPIVVYSNSARTAEEAELLGADGFLPNVFTPTQLRGQVHSLLDKSYAARAA